MPKEKGLAHISVILILLAVVITTTLLIKNPTKDFRNEQDIKGTLIAHEGEDSNSGSSGSSGSGSSGSSGSGSSGSSTSDSDDDSGSFGSGSSGSGSSGSTGTDTKTSEGVRIKTKTSEDREKIEIRLGGAKFKYELKNGRLIIKAENEEGVEEELEDEDEAELEEELEDEGIKIATVSGKLVLVKGNVGAFTHFPLRIDLETRQLIASTSAGERVLTVLPDVAVANMLKAHILSGFGPPFIRFATSSATATTSAQQSINQVVQLKIKDNKVVYEISGVKDFNLLGFISVTRSVTAIVSAETGDLVEAQTSILTKIIDFLSP